jgi:DNA-binding NtrC family response regulator
MATTRNVEKEHPPGLDPRWPYRAIRLLLVDDEAAFVDTLANRLKKRKFKVSRAYSGEGGIRLLKKADYDVAVVDLKMSSLDGLATLKVFREMAPDLPVIIFTGHGSEKSAEESLAYGAFDYLLKPYEFDDLLSKIKSAYHTGKEY